MNTDEIISRLEKATPGPWKAGRSDTVSQTYGEKGFYKNIYCPDSPNAEIHLGMVVPTIVARAYDVDEVDCRDNADFIAHAPEDIRNLLVEVERLNKAVVWMRDIGKFFAYKAPEQIDSCKLVAAMYATAQDALGEIEEAVKDA